MNKPIRVAVTGAGGQIGYALLFRLASGAAFGPDQPVALQLLEITPALPALDGTMMELEDCAFPLLSNAMATDKPEQAFEGGRLGGSGRWAATQGGAVSRRSDPGQQPDLHGSGEGDQQRGRAGGQGADRCQPV